MRAMKMCVCAGMVAAAWLAAGRLVGADDVSATLDRIGERVADYYANAQSIVLLETVRIQPEARDLMPDGFARVLVYDLRVEWTPPSEDGHQPEANIVRLLVSVNGKPPRPGDEDKCMDPEPVSPEPMSMLLPGRRQEYAFSLAGRAKTDGRAAVMLDYKSRVVGPASVKWNDTCVSVDLPGRSRGRVWVDADTSDVLRLDEQLVGAFQFDIPPKQAIFGRSPSMVLEQSSSSIHYQAVTFHDPDETLMLPRSVDTTTAWTNAGYARVRMTQTFSKYRRFVGDARLVR
jgi:hypothetical protein